MLLERFEDVFRQFAERIATARNDMGQQTKQRRLPAESIREQLEDFLKELPVIGFNSGKYDVNLIKRHLYSKLQRDDPLEFIVKRTGTYMVLKNQMVEISGHYQLPRTGLQLHQISQGIRRSSGKRFFSLRMDGLLRKT